MSEATFESVLTVFRRLPVREQAQLLEILAHELKREKPYENGQISPPVVEKDRSREEKWLAEHSHEYANQWVALEGDQLIAHSFNAAEVFAAVKFLGVERPLFVRVEDPDEPPFAGV
jgi:hypothetical protein